MAQKHFRNFQNDLGSFQHNIANLGLHNPGRYMGFDTLVPTAGGVILTFNLSHTGKGISYKNPNNDLIGPIGVILTPQGTVISEDAIIGDPFTVDTNAGNSSERYDLIYMVHDQVELVGGQSATYAIVKGPLNSTVKPTVPDIFKNTPIGYVILPVQESDIHNCIWQKAKTPDSGDGVDAQLDQVNHFTKLQQFNLSATPKTDFKYSVVNGGVTAKLWELENDGNVFEILPPPPFQKTLDGIKINRANVQQGTEISLIINERVILRETHLFEPTYNPLGFNAFKIIAALGNQELTTIPTENTLKGIRPLQFELWQIDLRFYQNNWVVINVGGLYPKPNSWITTPNNTAGAATPGGTVSDYHFIYLKTVDKIIHLQFNITFTINTPSPLYLVVPLPADILLIMDDSFPTMVTTQAIDNGAITVLGYVNYLGYQDKMLFVNTVNLPANTYTIIGQTFIKAL